MSYGREYLYQLSTSGCLGESALSKGMIRILESLTLMLTRAYYSGTPLEEKDIIVKIIRQIILRIVLM